ncbi:DUF3347 domain-containing protein [Nafulsella turpanensis]|uniref:DUF3347 domain-containing protein n=1 Tax=Nafulsella turpanensis TaxID=1265690 RepID=UPI00034D2232|nr:DUF3347 domain-containing protein [Nafulsella turpanensis]
MLNKKKIEDMKPQIKKYLLLLVVIFVATAALYAQGNLQEKPNTNQEKAADVKAGETKGESAMMDCCKNMAKGEGDMKDMMKMCHSMMGNMKMGDGMMDQQMEGMNMSQQDVETSSATTNSPLLNNYLDIKNALVNDSFEQAKKAVADFQTALEGAEKLSAAQKKTLEQSAAKLAQAKDLTSFREQFASFSRQVYQVEQASNLTDETLYLQHCSMAGANWLSLEEKVQNPYMGQRMPGCGSVQEALK